jgi:hypothetical protein
MNQRKSIARVGTSVFLLTGFLAASATVRADAPDSEQVSKLLSEAKTMAFQVKEDAVTMESYTRMNVSWEGHAAAIAQIREHVNDLGRQVAKLNAAKGFASPWQKVAIERINPFMDELGGYTSAVIDGLSGEQRPTTAEYTDYLEANADYATDLAAMIADFVNYGNAKSRMERQAEKLELSAKKTGQ